MAVIDAFTVFSGAFSAAGVVSGQAVTGTNTSVVSTNVYDTQGGSPTGQNIDLGKGGDLDIVARVLTNFVGLTSLEIQYCSADDTALSTNLTVLGSTGAVPIAVLLAGNQVVLSVPPAQPRATRRYIGINYVIVGAGSAGAIFTSLQSEHGDVPQPAYQSGFTVL
jgi:hypothetical protein